MKGLGAPVENRYPAVVDKTNQIAPLTAIRDLDLCGYLKGVTTFNFHPHLPHYALTSEGSNSVHVLARQAIDMSRQHPFKNARNREFNAFVWMPPKGRGAGDVLPADSTIRWRGVSGELLEKPRCDAAHEQTSRRSWRMSCERWIEVYDLAILH
jgi:hypothetical protein